MILLTFGVQAGRRVYVEGFGSRTGFGADLGFKALRVKCLPPPGKPGRKPGVDRESLLSARYL